LIWKVEWDDRAAKELRRLSVEVQQKILRFFRTRISVPENPRRFGRALSRELHGLWRYRLGDYRMICRIEQDRMVVLVVRVGHRSHVYR